MAQYEAQRAAGGGRNYAVGNNVALDTEIAEMKTFIGNAPAVYQ